MQIEAENVLPTIWGGVDALSPDPHGSHRSLRLFRGLPGAEPASDALVA